MDQPKKNHGRPKNAHNKHSQKPYTEDDMQRALQKLKDNPNLSGRKVAEEYKIPESSLRKRRNYSTISPVYGSNNKMLLTPDEEKLLKGYIVKQAQRGFGLDRAGVINFLTGFLHHDYNLEKKQKYPYNEHCDSSTNSRFSRPGIKPEGDHKKWYELFMKRHQDLKKRVPEQISAARSAVTQTSIYQWFSDISSVFNDKDDPQLAAALEDPLRIFNMDETSVQLCSIPNYVITSPVIHTGQDAKDMFKQIKHIYYRNPSQEKSNLTVLTTVQASGQVLPPLVIYPRSRLTNIDPKITDPKTGKEMHYVLGKSPSSGWITSAILYEYLVNDFHQWLKKKKFRDLSYCSLTFMTQGTTTI